jgi:hypothetical protein
MATGGAAGRYPIGSADLRAGIGLHPPLWCSVLAETETETEIGQRGGKVSRAVVPSQAAALRGPERFPREDQQL